MRARKGASTGTGKWLLTFNDLTTLLLTFFVLILSCSNLNEGKMEEISWSFRRHFGFMGYQKGTDIKVFVPFIVPLSSRVQGYYSRKIEVAEAFKDIEGVEVQVIDDGVSLRLGETLLFDSGNAGIKEGKRAVLMDVARVLQDAGEEIVVEGHTDDVPLRGGVYESNWELSVARAVNVVKFLVEEAALAPERLSAAGYADTQPLGPNNAKRNRERNRRVDIVIKVKKS